MARNRLDIVGLQDILIPDNQNMTGERDEDNKYQVLNDALFNINKENILLKTDLNDREIKVMNKLITISDRFDLTMLNNIVERFLRMRVSKDRKGRGEILGSVEADIKDKYEQERRHAGENRGEIIKP